MGGELPWLPLSIYQGAAGSTGLGMPDLGTALFADGLTPNSVVGPVLETSTGYMVAVFEGRRPEASQRVSDAALRIASGMDFGQEAALVSEGVESADNGNIGWVTHYSLTQDLEDAIFQTPVGGISRTVLVSSSTSTSSYYIFKVLDEKTQKPQTPEEVAELKTKVFTTWLTDLTDHTNIWTDQASLTKLYPSASA